MRLIGRTARCGLIGALVATATVAAVTATPAGADGPPPAAHYSYTALPVNVFPLFVNKLDQVLASAQGGSGYAVWHDGVLTTLQRATPPGNDVAEPRPPYLGDSGEVVASTDFNGYDTTYGSYIKVDGGVVEEWQPGQYAAAPHTLPLPQVANNYMPDVSWVNGSGQFVVQGICCPPSVWDTDGTSHPTGLGSVIALSNSAAYGSITHGTGDGNYAIDNYAEDIASGALTGLDFSPSQASANGTLVGTKAVGSDGVRILRSTTGAETVLPEEAQYPNGQTDGVDDAGDVVVSGYNGTSGDSVLFHGSTTPVPVATFLPPGVAGTPTTVRMASNGDLAGVLYVAAANGKPATYTGFLLHRQDDTVHGTVLEGTAPGTASDPASPASDVPVTVAGTTATGASFSATTTTGTDGTWGVHAPAGTYTVTFPADVCARDGATTCDTTASAMVDQALDPVTVDAIALRAHLAVKVTANPQQTTLKLDKTGTITPKPVTVTVAVTNDGSQPVTDVTAAPKLTVGYHDPDDVAVPDVPLRYKTGPSPKADMGTLAPGKSASVTYTLSAEGDGNYDVDAIVTGADPKDRTVKGAGETQVLIGSPVLVEKTSMGRHVAARGTKLDVAGTNFSIHLQLQNLSYTKKIAVAPIFCTPGGNASDGHTQPYAQAIQNLPPATETLSEAFTLAPRAKADLGCVLRTSTIPADTLIGEKSNGGGTRATATVPTPQAWFVKDNVKGKQLSGTDLFVEGDKTFTVSLDDSDLRAEPEAATIVGDAYYFTVGGMRGLWNLTGGCLSGLFHTLPSLVASGMEHVPTALVGYVRMQMELFNAIKGSPAKLALFLNPLTNTSLAMYEKAPELIGNATEFKNKISKDVLDAYTKTWNDWYSGNRQRALTDFGREFIERSGDIALAVAPGLLARNPKVLAAFVDAQSRTYAQVSEKLAQYQPKLVNAIEATKVLDSYVKPGFQMSNVYLRKFFGLTDAQSQFLRRFAEEHKLLIVVRSRAAESIKWIERYGAVLKPEMIKIKNVNWLDTFLGFRESDVGRVVIKTDLPSAATVKSTLRRKGFRSGDAQWEAVLKRLAQREEELASTDEGSLHDLRKIDKREKVTIRFNLAGNVVDPTVATAKPTTYGFRLQPVAGRKGELVPEFFVKGRWRSVTGDVDFLQLTHANGTPLTDAQRIAIYQKISKSPVGFLHGESATWAKSAGVFDFEKKYGEFERTGIVAQFAPDGQSRAVKFVRQLSNFSSKFDYRVNWDGGYVLPQGPAVP